MIDHFKYWCLLLCLIITLVITGQTTVQLENNRWSFYINDQLFNVKGVTFGLIEDDQPYPDSDIELIEVKLTNEWKKYSIKTKRSDLSCIRSGFVIFTGGEGLSHQIYIDDIVYE